MSEDNRYILILGDSFAANGSHYNKKGSLIVHYPIWHDGNCWVDIVANQFPEHRVLNFGFGGQGWWYGRLRLMAYLEENPEVLDQIDYVVHTLTDYSLRPLWKLPISSHSHHFKLLKADPTMAKQLDGIDFDQMQLMKALNTQLAGPEFPEWAVKHWLGELNSMFKHAKVINFHCFKGSIPLNIIEYIPDSIVFDNHALIEISVGEITGNKAETDKAIEEDERISHFCPDNHHRFADLIIRAFNTYSPGLRDINPDDFYWPNPNSVNTFHGGYWSTFDGKDLSK